MKTGTLRRTLAVALVMLTMLAVALPAMAASQVYATTNVNVRSEPRVGSNIIGSLSKGEVVTKLGTSGNWTKIDYKGRTGYVNTPYVKAYSGSGNDSVVIIDDGTTVYVNAAVNVRSGPGTNYAKLGELKKGDAVSLVGSTGSWSIIKWGTGTAYVSSAYLSQGSTGGGTTSGTTMVATANVNVRTGPSTSYPVIGYLVQGETVQKTGTSGNWTQVRYKNQTAYVSSSYLKAYTGGSTYTPAPDTTSLLYATKATAVRSGPSTAYRAIGYLDAGDSITYLGVYNASWYQVQLGVNVGYVYAPDMRMYGSGSTTGGTVYATSTVPVYSSTSTSAYLLGYLYNGDSAARTGTVGSTWTKINFQGTTGYVLTSQVVVAAGGTSTAGFTTLNTWMYALSSYTYCYSIPSEQSAYRTGYLDRNEQVWAVATNGVWIQILVNGSMMYVPASKLAYYNGPIGSGSGSLIGSTVYVQKYAGATTYKNTSGTIYEFKEGGEYVSRVTRGKALTVLFQIGSYYNVSWRDADGDYHTAYVEVDRVGPNYPY